MNRIYTIFSAIALLVLLMSNKGGRAFQENEGSTGAPGEPVYCKNCHNANIVVAVDIFVIDGKDTVKTYVPEKTIAYMSSSDQPEDQHQKVTAFSLWA